MEALLASGINFTIFFYNPNIHSLREYKFRAQEMNSYARQQGLPFKLGEFEVAAWFEAVKLAAWAMEKSRKRCEICIFLRLKKTAEQARTLDVPLFTTTLSVSPHKDAQQINRPGARVQEEVGVEYLPADFKQFGGFARSVELSRAAGMYRQAYCGCVYSMLERKRASHYNRIK